MTIKLTQDRLKELLNYNTDTGIFTWKIDMSNKVKSGSIAGTLSDKGYWKIKIDGKNYRAHRLVFLYEDGYLPENQIDHIDRDKINNRRKNLREVSQSCNSRNCKVSNANKVGVTGVSWNKQLKNWQSRIMVFGKPIYLGLFDNLIDAAQARWEAEKQYNFPNCNTISSAYMYLKEHGGLEDK